MRELLVAYEKWLEEKKLEDFVDTISLNASARISAFLSTYKEQDGCKDFETQYALQEFRRWQPEQFDESGKSYTGTPVSHRSAEEMLRLIDLLVKELKYNVTS